MLKSIRERNDWYKIRRKVDSNSNLFGYCKDKSILVLEENKCQCSSCTLYFIIFCIVSVYVCVRIHLCVCAWVNAWCGWVFKQITFLMVWTARKQFILKGIILYSSAEFLVYKTFSCGISYFDVFEISGRIL